MAEDDRPSFPPHVVGTEERPRFGPCAEEREYLGGNGPPFEPPRLARARHRHARPVPAPIESKTRCSRAQSWKSGPLTDPVASAPVVSQTMASRPASG